MDSPGLLTARDAGTTAVEMTAGPASGTLEVTVDPPGPPGAGLSASAGFLLAAEAASLPERRREPDLPPSPP